MANVFENNEGTPGEAIIVEKLDDNLPLVLPKLEEGQRYDFTKLADGRVSITVVEGTDDGQWQQWAKSLGSEGRCGCGPYQGCARCGKYQGDDLNTPESRTLRHGDGFNIAL